MKIQYYVLSFFCVAILGACDSSETDELSPVVEQLAVDIPANPDAERGDPPSFTFFDLETGTILTKADSNSTKWDLAFSSTTILTNNGSSGPGAGGAQMQDGIFEQLNVAPIDGYRVDQEGEPAVANWYRYNDGSATPAHAILAIPGRIIFVKTGEGNYAKVEILSYYKGNPDTSSELFANLATRPEDRYYTFRYVVLENGRRQFN